MCGPWLFFLELCSLTPYLPIGALICRRRRNLGLIAESIQNNLSHLLHASFYCSSTAQPVQLFHSRSLQCSTYLKVVLPCSYCSLLLILECSVFFLPLYHTHYTRQCSPLAPSYLCFPISPLCCVVLPAFLSCSLITCSENLTG